MHGPLRRPRRLAPGCAKIHADVIAHRGRRPRADQTHTRMHNLRRRHHHAVMPRAAEAVHTGGNQVRHRHSRRSAQRRRQLRRRILHPSRAHPRLTSTRVRVSTRRWMVRDESVPIHRVPRAALLHAAAVQEG